MVRAGTNQTTREALAVRKSLVAVSAAIAVAQEWAVSSARESGGDGERTIAGGAQLQGWRCSVLKCIRGCVLGQPWAGRWAGLMVRAQWWQRREAERDTHTARHQKTGYTHRAGRG